MRLLAIQRCAMSYTLHDVCHVGTCRESETKPELGDSLLAQEENVRQHRADGNNEVTPIHYVFAWL